MTSSSPWSAPNADDSGLGKRSDAGLPYGHQIHMGDQQLLSCGRRRSVTRKAAVLVAGSSQGYQMT
ncbi:hypothetical protein ABH926_006311 [Catenulispora sp. GP43]